MHTHFLLVDGAKMAKSAGGFFRLDDLIARGHDPLAFRMLALGVSYRKGLRLFTWEASRRSGAAVSWQLAHADPRGDAGRRDADEAGAR